jgi:TPR repeat protein
MNPIKLNLLRSLCEKKDHQAMLVLANYYFYDQNKQDLSSEVFEMIFNYYQELAESGNSQAMATLGTMYYEGVNIPQDFKLAKYWCEQSSKKENPLGLIYLGYCYYYGRNIPQDFKKSYHLFEKAAFLGHHNGMYKLGDIYYNGHYVSKNTTTAFYWYCEAEAITSDAIPEYPNIAYRIGHCYLLGEGIQSDLLLSLSWLQKSEHGCYTFIQNGDAYAHLTLVRVKEDLSLVYDKLNHLSNYHKAELGYHNPLKL